MSSKEERGGEEMRVKRRVGREISQDCSEDVTLGSHSRNRAPQFSKRGEFVITSFYGNSVAPLAPSDFKKKRPPLAPLTPLYELGRRTNMSHATQQTIATTYEHVSFAEK